MNDSGEVTSNSLSLTRLNLFRDVIIFTTVLLATAWLVRDGERRAYQRGAHDGIEFTLKMYENAINKQQNPRSKTELRSNFEIYNPVNSWYRNRELRAGVEP